MRDGLDLVVEFATLGEYRLPEALGAGTAAARTREGGSRPVVHRSVLRPSGWEGPRHRERCDARRRTGSVPGGRPISG